MQININRKDLDDATDALLNFESAPTTWEKPDLSSFYSHVRSSIIGAAAQCLDTALEDQLSTRGDYEAIRATAFAELGNEKTSKNKMRRGIILMGDIPKTIPEEIADILENPESYLSTLKSKYDEDVTQTHLDLTQLGYRIQEGTDIEELCSLAWQEHKEMIFAPPTLKDYIRKQFLTKILASTTLYATIPIPLFSEDRCIGYVNVKVVPELDGNLEDIKEITVTYETSASHPSLQY